MGPFHSTLARALMAQEWDEYGRPIEAAPQEWDEHGRPITEDPGDDPLRSFASHAKRAVTAIPGMAGDFANLFGNIGNKLGLPQYEAGPGGFHEVPRQAPDTYAGPVWTSPQVHGALTDAAASMGVPEAFPEQGYQAKTEGARWAGGVGDAIGAAAAPGGLGTRLLRMGVAGIGQEGAGRVAQDVAPDWETEARVLGGAGGSMLGEGTLVRGVGPKIDAGLDHVYANTLGRIQATPAQTNMAGGGYRIGPAPPPPEPAPPPINRDLVKKGRMTPEKFDAEMAPYEAQGVDPFEFQGYGKRAGVAKLEGLSRDANLSVGDMAKEAIDPAMDALQQRALSGVAKMVSGEASAADAGAAIEALQNKIRDTAHEYDPVLHDRAVTPRLEERTDAILDRIDAKDLDAIKAEAQKLAKSLGYKELNDARVLQFIKQQLWNHAEDMVANPKTAMRGGVYKQLWGELRQALHEEIPGYGEIDAKYSNPLDRAKIAEKLHERIAKKIDGTSPGNIGRNLYEATNMREAFGPDRADPFLAGQKLIAKDAGDFNRVAPDRNSVTASAGSEMVSSLAEGLRRGDFGKAAMNWIGQKGADVVDIFDANGRNQLGEQLLSKMTPERRAQFRKQLEEIEAEKKRALLAQALAASSASRPPAPPQQEAR